MSTHPAPAELEGHRDKRRRLGELQSHGNPQSAYGEVDYDEIDRDINSTGVVQHWRRQYREDFNETLCPLLLTIIVAKSKGHLDSQYENVSTAASLLQGEKGLTRDLLAAWKSGTFEDILTLDYLRCMISSSTSFESEITTSEMAQFDMESVQRSVKDAWTVSYIGSYHIHLLQKVNRIKRNDPYMNICAIIQSSGTGKSRMVDEQAKLVYTLPINLRSSERTNAAYPPPDEPLYAHFVNTLGGVADCKQHYIKFFSCLFTHATKELGQFKMSSRRRREKFATLWYDCMNDQGYRKAFYTEVVKMCKSTGATTLEGARESLSKLIREMDRFAHKTHDIKIMIYIDEAHELKHTYRSGNTRPTQLDILCSAIAEFSDLPLFCLLLSTQSSLPFLAPPGEAATSERARQRAGALLAPITETPFDCAPNIRVSPGHLYLTDLTNITFLAKWGRPLWWSMAEKANTWSDLQELIKFAQMKLLRSHNIHAPLSMVPATTQLALVDVPISFDYEPSCHGAHEAQVAMVTDHMRIVYSVPQHRKYFRSGYPSEPILAEAALQQIYEFQLEHGSGNVMARILQQGWDRNSLVDLGQRGEVVMRLLLMQAYINAVQVEYTSADDDSSAEDTPSDDLEDVTMDDTSESSSTPHLPNMTNECTTTTEAQRLILFSQGCSLVTFIKQLFSSQPASEILNSKPDNLISNATFHATFQNSVVRFTHFVKAGDTSALTTDALFAAFVKGMAFICHQTQRYVDLVIPVLLDKSNALQESAMSAILIQVKRRVHTRSGGAYTFRQEDVGLFPQNDKFPERPYITLIAELGGTPSGNTKEGTPREVYISQQPQVQHHPCETHPRFAATVYGCSNKVYKAVGEGRGDFDMLLATHDFLEEHPYRDEVSLSSVTKLKPFWKYGDTYDWVESEVLNKQP